MRAEVDFPSRLVALPMTIEQQIIRLSQGGHSPESIAIFLSVDRTHVVQVLSGNSTIQQAPRNLKRELSVVEGATAAPNTRVHGASSEDNKPK